MYFAVILIDFARRKKQVNGNIERKWMMLVMIKHLSMGWLCAGHIQNEQINERINEGEEKAVTRRKRRIFHANQINDNLCLYIYVCVYVCLSHHVFVYIKSSFSRFSAIYSINFTLNTNNLHICRCVFLTVIFP